jgi:hypothetical protein
MAFARRKPPEFNPCGEARLGLSPCLACGSVLCSRRDACTFTNFLWLARSVVSRSHGEQPERTLDAGALRLSQSCFESLARPGDARPLSHPWRGQRLRGLVALAAGVNREPAGPRPVRSVSCWFLSLVPPLGRLVGLAQRRFLLMVAVAPSPLAGVSRSPTSRLVLPQCGLSSLSDREGL